MNNEIKKTINDTRINLIKMHQDSPHIGSSLSSLEIISILYFKIMNIESVDDPDRDRFILSKGHAISALYAVLSKKGFLNESLENFSKNGSKLVSHPVRNYCPGVEVSSGSLGHGLAIAVGISYAFKKDLKPCKTFVLMGDGECQEGSVWEAAILASRLKLGNLVAIIDANGLQDSEYVDNIQPIQTFKGKWGAFGWNVVECSDIVEELSRVVENNITQDKPLLVIAYTIKGKGIKEIENQLHSHRYVVPKEKVQYLIEELKKQL